MSLHQSLPPGCEPTCHGCRHRDWPTARSLEQKHAYLARVLAPWADRLEPVASADEHRRLGYRDRVTLTARRDDEAGWRFGLVRRDELIAIHDCPVHSARVNATVRLLRETLPRPDLFPLAYLHVAGAQATLIVKARQVDLAQLDRLRTGLPDTGLEGLWVHCHPAAGRRMFARSGWHLVWGVPASRDPSGLTHGPAAFQQLLPELHEQALDAAEAFLAPRAATAVLDLYCGLGASMQRWRKHDAAVLGIELAGGAIEAATLNAPGATLLRGTCVQRLPQLREWWRAQAGDRLAYANPPRSGLEAEVTMALANELRPRRLGYLSCSAGTLARDLAGFESAGYVVERILPYDFFPRTHHVETLALLRDRVG